MAALLTREDFKNMNIDSLRPFVEQENKFAIDALAAKLNMNGQSVNTLLKVAAKAVSVGMPAAKEEAVKDGAPNAAAKNEAAEGGAKVIGIETNPAFTMVPKTESQKEIPTVVQALEQKDAEVAQLVTAAKQTLTTEQTVNAYKQAVDSGLMARAPFAETAAEKQKKADMLKAFKEGKVEFTFAGTQKPSAKEAFEENQLTATVMNHSMLRSVTSFGYKMAPAA